MGFLKGLLVGLVLSSIGFFYYTIQNSRVVENAPLAIEQDRQIHWGEQAFHDGAYHAIKGRNLTEACTLPNPHEALICQEGFFFVDFSKELNKISDNLSAESISRSIRLDSISQALGFGMALSLRRISPDQFRGPGAERYRRYIEDGWGFHGTFRNFRGAERAFEECRILKDPKDCYFGAGRSLFFRGFTREEAAKIAPEAEMGFDFATIFGTQDDRAELNPIQKVAAGLKSPDPEDPMKLCMRTAAHFSTCISN